MPNDTSHIAQTLDEFKRELADKIGELRSLLSTINMLEDRLGIPRSVVPDALVGSQTLPTSVQTSTEKRGSVSVGSIRPDQFLGDPPLEAAKRYIETVGHAVHFDEIAEAVQRGGAAIKGGGWKDKLETSLIRSVYEVVKVQEKTFGLTSFYTEEQIRRLRGARARPEPARKKRGARKATNKKPRVSDIGKKDETASD